MKRPSNTSVRLLRSLLLIGSLAATSSVFAVETFKYEPQLDFFKLPTSIQLAGCSAAAVDSQGNYFLLHRGQHPVICCDKRGQFVRTWGDGVFAKPHGMRIDHDDNIWITDIQQHVVRKFTPTGELLLTLGTLNSPGAAENQFNKPTDIAFGAHGIVYISDGYINTRVMTFAPDGKLIRTWGKPGSGRGELSVPHSIAIDSKGQIVIGDSGNKRIQVFDKEGNVLEVWDGMTALGLAYDPQGNLFVSCGPENRILQLSDQGKVVATWGQEGILPGEFRIPHMLAADAEGNLIACEVNGMRFQRLVRK
ncbi:MAG: peptidyl-alpha-hydroxyglycine alpha-amidating lyase family protein [Planctomycetota bacterium]|nr:peptidyl-alpha-hydroxyglycine alpha-amidating lyase family protein [Planctomycetota bacterium]MDA1177260.1 peptidyl-alpha-hydroxyglycine alpha-amidating lyase family protein [Planctomycetota bacterium]